MTEPTLPEKKTSPFAMIGAGIAGVAILVFLLVGFHQDDLPVVPTILVENTGPPPPTIEAAPPPPWVNQTGINLAPLGNLPSLQTAAEGNPVLQRALSEFAAKDDAQLFANYARTDADITAILLLWAGADLDQGGMTYDGTDRRVALFLQRVYGLPIAAPTRNHPRMGRDPWPRLFAQYKVRLIAQTKGGAAPFTGTLRYLSGSDRIELENGGLNRRFFADFGKFVRGQPNADALRNNLLSYVRAVDPSLLDKDPQTLALIR